MTRSANAAVAGLALAAVVALAGCGGGDDDEANLAELAPADAVVFTEGVVRPEGDVRDGLESFLEKFPDGDTVGERLIESIDESSEDDEGDFTWEDDIEPWLGESAAFFATELSFDVGPGDGEDVVLEAGAVIVEVTDEEQAREKLRESADEDEDFTEREYEGVDYDLIRSADPGDLSALAVFDGVAVAGTEDGLKAAIDARDEGSFSDQADYAEFRDERADGQLASLYVDVQGIVDQIPASLGFTEQDRAIIEEVYKGYLDLPVLASVNVADDQATLDVSTGFDPNTDLEGAQTPLLAAGFEDSWAAFGAADIGESIQGSFSAGASFGLPQAQIEIVDRELQRELGVGLTDLASFGDLGVFAAGESIADLRVGAVVELPGGLTQKKLLGVLRRALNSERTLLVRPLGIEADGGFSVTTPEIPFPINIAAEGDRVVIAGGDEATEALLAGDGGLSGSSLFGSATEALGEGSAVDFLVQFAPIEELVESTGADDDEDYEEAKPYLDALDFATIGGRREDDRDVTRFVLKVR